MTHEQKLLTEKFSRRIRCAGIYRREKKILFVKHRKENKEYYLLPGGGHEDGETLKETLIREWKEELKLDIKVGELLFCTESLAPPSVGENKKRRHILQLVFEVKDAKGNIEVGADGVLFAYEWLPMEAIDDAPLFPPCAPQILQTLENKNIERYRLYKWKE